MKYGLSLDMEDKCSAIPPALARLCSIPPSNIVLVDIVQSQVCLTRKQMVGYIWNFYRFAQYLALSRKFEGWGAPASMPMR